MMMRKLLFTTAILASSMISAQKVNFRKNYSTANLQKLHNAVENADKKEFYKQYLRAKLAEEMKSKFVYKNYNTEILQKFSDTIVSHYDDGKYSYNDTKDLTPKKSETYEEFVAFHKQYIYTTPKEIEKIKNSEILSDSDKKMLIDLKNQRLSEALKKTEKDLRNEYDAKLKQEQDDIENDPKTEKNRGKIIAELDNMISENISDDEKLMELLQNNLNPDRYFMNTFPSLMEDSVFSIYEEIPGDIICFDNNGGGSMTYRMFFKTIKNDLQPISIIPENEEEFLNKINNYTLKKDILTFYSGNGNLYSGIKEKSKDGFYIISGMLFSEFSPAYEIEYKTKDFKNFIPLRIKDMEESSNWETIK